MSTDLAKQKTNTSIMTQTKAIYLLKTVWPNAPDDEVIKASIICATYGLNPLLKQVSLISFKNKNGGVSWVTVLGIKATRNIALGTGHKYGYIDGPRVMTEDEQKTIFGQTYPDRIVAITKIKDHDGNIYPGYGFYPKDGSVQGADKGNSVANMAFIRSERNALDKMAPGQLPNTEVIDEEFTEVKVNNQTLEAGRQETIAQAENDIEELFGDGEPTKAPVVKAEFDIDWLMDKLKSINWNEKTTRSYLFAKYKVQTDGTIPEIVARLIPAQRDSFFKEIEDRKAMA